MIRTVDTVDAAKGKITYKKTTPKKLASEILWAAVRAQLDTAEFDDAMTKREQKLVYCQMVKQARRIGKLLGYELYI